MDWNKLASEETIKTVADMLKGRGMEVIVADNADDAKNKLLALIPEGVEVMEGASETLDQIGVTQIIDESGRYKSLRKEIRSADKKDFRDVLRRRSSSPEYAIGSVQAITRAGQIVAASASGSQLAPYVYGAAHLILVVGTNKIVDDLDQAFKRIYEYALPLESERVHRLYGMAASSVNKILILEKERPDRIKVILVKQKLGF